VSEPKQKVELPKAVGPERTDPYFTRVAVLRYALGGDTERVKAALVELSDEQVAQLAKIFTDLADITKRWQISKNQLAESVHNLRMVRHSGRYNGFPVSDLNFED
jgi:hypothetical protein